MTIDPKTHRPHRFLVAESETEDAREKRRAYTGRSSGETYKDLLEALVPDAVCDLVQPIETGQRAEPPAPLKSYDAIFLAGSPLHVYEKSPKVDRQLAFMRAVFASQTPSFGSCAGLQVAVAAAGGTVRPNKRGHEVAFARRITLTEAGRNHPLMSRRPDAFDAPAIHSDEVEHLPAGATLLATNRVTAVQAAEVRFDGGVFWGVQYHPELPIYEVADALRRQASDIVKNGFAPDAAAVEDYARLLDFLDREPTRRDISWRLGLDEQVTDPTLRQSEVRNFIRYLVEPTRSARVRA